MSDQNEKNYYKVPLKILSTAIVMLLLVSLMPKDLTVFGIELRHVDILADLKAEPEVEEQTDEDEYYEDDNSDDEYYEDDSDEYYEDEDPDSNSTGLELNQFQYKHASFSFAYAITDAVNDFVEVETAKIKDYMASTKPVLKGQAISGNVGQLKYFVDAVKRAKNQKVRIAHYGDSAIEGDLVTADLRKNLQTKFGGKGAGFVAITSQDTKFRTTTKQSFSSNWTAAALYSNNRKKLPLGIAGSVAVPKGKSWVEYEGKPHYRNTKNFSTVRLFYSDAKRSSINYSFDGGSSKTAKLKSGAKVSELILTSGKTVRKIKITTSEKEQANFFGVSLENGNGLYVDNLPLRGNSGVDLIQLDDQILKEFGKLLNYKLIIFEFGLNALGTGKGNYNWYEREMIKVINKFKKAFPKTSFLLVSSHDKSKKKGSKFETDPEVLKLVKAQKNIVKETKIAFWNMFEAMGGKNSMPKWVNANPPLAFKDYTHFNGQGGKKIADMLADAIVDIYNKKK